MAKEFALNIDELLTFNTERIGDKYIVYYKVKQYMLDELSKNINDEVFDAIATNKGYAKERVCKIESVDNNINEPISRGLYLCSQPVWHLSCGHSVKKIGKPMFCYECGARVIEGGS